MLAYTDVFLPNDDEAEAMTGLKDPVEQATFSVQPESRLRCRDYTWALAVPSPAEAGKSFRQGPTLCSPWMSRAPAMPLLPASFGSLGRLASGEDVEFRQCRRRLVYQRLGMYGGGVYV